MNRLNEFLQEHGGVENFRCFAQMRCIDMVIQFMGIAITSDRCTWTECRIDERHYKVEDGYKITLVPLDPAFVKQDFYQNDFMSSVRSGHIIPKSSDEQHVEHIRFFEPLAGAAYLVHSGDMVAPTI